MKLFDSFLINCIFISYPLILYLFYVAHNRNIEKKENDLFLGLALFSSMYLLIKLDITIIDNTNMLLVNIPIIISYIKNKRIEGMLLSIIAISYYCSISIQNPILLIIEYIIYFLISLLKNKQLIRINDYNFGSILLLLRFIIYCNNSCEYKLLSLEMFFGFLFNFIIMIFVIWIIKKGDDILKYHMTFKELEQEKQIRLSLFKITHEIKNPLAVCKGYLDMINPDNSEQCNRYVPIIKEEIDRTLLLLQDFLSVNKIKLDMDILDINLLLEETIKSLNNLLKAKNIKLYFDDVDEVYISGDYNRLVQVIINIIKNSIEALEERDDAYIRICTKIDKKYVYIICEDNGEGITKENLVKIQEPFFTTKPKGTGLGVSLSYEIIKAHNGKIIYESEYSKGTTVIIKIPLMD